MKQLTIIDHPHCTRSLCALQRSSEPTTRRSPTLLLAASHIAPSLIVPRRISFSLPVHVTAHVTAVVVVASHEALRLLHHAANAAAAAALLVVVAPGEVAGELLGFPHIVGHGVYVLEEKGLCEDINRPS